MAEEAMVPTKATQRAVARMDWLDGVAEKLQRLFEPLVGQSAPQALRDLLYGTKLGHPLHPVLVDLPIGFWTAALVLDAAREERAADLMVGAGLAGALGAALSGAAQWQDATHAMQPRRTGALHALVNVGATALYGCSLLSRRRGRRGAGVAFGVAGCGLLTVGGWLGGDLAFDLGLGVNRTAFEQPPTDWTDAVAERNLEDGKPHRVVAAGVAILLLKRGDRIEAIAATCPHLGGPLDEGKIAGDEVTCPWHGSVFSLRDGRLLHGPATAPVMAYETKTEAGRVLVRARPTPTASTADR
jgi:nitrite reductase/ring-hydroxylating ferredoxin subunit/uncharacterized membrane protein